mmetsp:Transcript_5348/g.17314  ORF Transcript_5348/g.17314 Transcript_5348/m.17314 type:complete len:205 (-) Transcript_5348:3565-4179(-)
MELSGSGLVPKAVASSPSSRASSLDMMVPMERFMLPTTGMSTSTRAFMLRMRFTASWKFGASPSGDARPVSPPTSRDVARWCSSGNSPCAAKGTPLTAHTTDRMMWWSSARTPDGTSSSSPWSWFWILWFSESHWSRSRRLRIDPRSALAGRITELRSRLANLGSTLSASALGLSRSQRPTSSVMERTPSLAMISRHSSATRKR